MENEEITQEVSDIIDKKHAIYMKQKKGSCEKNV